MNNSHKDITCLLEVILAILVYLRTEAVLNVLAIALSTQTVVDFLLFNPVLWHELIDYLVVTVRSFLAEAGSHGAVALAFLELTSVACLHFTVCVELTLLLL